MTHLNVSETVEALKSAIGSKVDYVPRTLDEARQDLIERAQETALALRAEKVRPYHPAPMAMQQKKTGLFCVKIGYGKNNAYMANAVHSAGQLLRYNTADQAASALEDLIMPLVEAGEFDTSLGNCLASHKDRAKQRVMVAKVNRKAGPSLTNPDEVFIPQMAAE